MFQEIKQRADDLRSTLVAELDQLEARRKEVLSELTCIDAMLSEMDKHEQVTGSSKPKRRGKARKPSPSKQQIVEATVDLLASNKGQMVAGDLLELVKQRMTSQQLSNQGTAMLFEQVRKTDLIEVSPGVLSVKANFPAVPDDTFLPSETKNNGYDQ